MNRHIAPSQLSINGAMPINGSFSLPEYQMMQQGLQLGQLDGNSVRRGSVQRLRDKSNGRTGNGRTGNGRDRGRSINEQSNRRGPSNSLDRSEISPDSDRELDGDSPELPHNNLQPSTPSPAPTPLQSRDASPHLSPEQQRLVRKRKRAPRFAVPAVTAATQAVDGAAAVPENLKDLYERLEVAFACSLNLDVSPATLELPILYNPSADDDNEPDGCWDSFFSNYIFEAGFTSGVNSSEYTHTWKAAHSWQRQWKSRCLNEFTEHVKELRQTTATLDAMPSEARQTYWKEHFDPRNMTTLIPHVSKLIDFVKSCDVSSATLTDEEKDNHKRTRVWFMNVYVWVAEAMFQATSVNPRVRGDMSRLEVCKLVSALCQSVPPANPKHIVFKPIKQAQSERPLKMPKRPSEILQGFRVIT